MFYLNQNKLTVRRQTIETAFKLSEETNLVGEYISLLFKRGPCLRA